MSEAKYTPGPWTWGENYKGLYGSGQDNEVMTYATYEGMWLAYTEHQEANAALIKSAPDLYEALVELLPFLSEERELLDFASLNEGRASPFDTASVKARAALKKATP